VKRLVWWALGAIALYFGVQGGEYSTRDLFVLSSKTRRLEQHVDSVQHEVDSLGRFLRLVKSDSATQERIAREEFGMVRGDKEILYRFGDDSGSSRGKSR
jgi:cell division protein FtsB